MSASDSSKTATQQTAPPQPRTTWSERETWALISLWEEHLDHLRGERRNARVYDRIVQGLARLEIIRTRKQVQSKIDNLTQMYRMYFNEIHRFLGTLPANDQSLVEESAAHSDATVEQFICSMEHGYESPNNNEDEWELEPSEAVPTSELADEAPSQRSRITNENQRRSRKRKLTSTSEFQRDLLNEQRLLRQALESATKEDRVLRERQINAQERLVGLLEQYFNKD
nr:myb/SANT-like DNA-binding domain-containing protein 1 [Dermacentor andersoni]